MSESGIAAETERETALKPCPCCGGQAHVRYEIFDNWMSVVCDRCGLSTRVLPVSKLDPFPAARAWNRRIGETDGN